MSTKPLPKGGEGGLCPSALSGGRGSWCCPDHQNQVCAASQSGLVFSLLLHEVDHPGVLRFSAGWGGLAALGKAVGGTG